MNKATFSKWRRVGDSIYGKNGGENCKIATVETERFDFQREDVEDCARLIANAPELFEQFKAMRDELMNTHYFINPSNNSKHPTPLEKAGELIADVQYGETRKL